MPETTSCGRHEPPSSADVVASLTQSAGVPRTDAAGTANVVGRPRLRPSAAVRASKLPDSVIEWPHADCSVCGATTRMS